MLGLTYDTRPEQIDEIVEEIRRLILAQPEVDPTSPLVFFRGFSASSLDIFAVYMTKTPDFIVCSKVQQRLNIAFMQAVAARGLSFAFPTQTVVLDGPIAKKIADRPALPPTAVG